MSFETKATNIFLFLLLIINELYLCIGALKVKCVRLDEGQRFKSYGICSFILILWNS